MRLYIKSLIFSFLLLFALGFVSAQSTPCDLLKKLGDDIGVAGTTLRPFFESPANAGGKGIKAWETLIDLPLLRTNVTKLQAVSNFAVAKNIDPSIIKTELQSLPNVHKEELVKSMEVANRASQKFKLVL